MRELLGKLLQGGPWRLLGDSKELPSPLFDGFCESGADAVPFEDLSDSIDPPS